MPRRLCVLLVCCLGLLAGCGGGDGKGSSKDTPADDETAARTAVTTYLSAMADRDGAAACAAMTTDLQKQLTAAVAKSPELKGKSCADLLNRVTRLGGGQAQKVFAAAEKGKITNVQVKGDRATMVNEASPGGRPVRIKYEAQRVGDRWLMSCCLAG